jgi:hypothetical protein
MKFVISFSILFALSGVLCQETLIFGLGKRQVDDQFLTRITRKSETFSTPQTIRVDLDYDLGTKYYTYIRFTTPNKGYVNATARDIESRNSIQSTFFANNELSFQVDALVYGYLYSPGPIYP